MNDEANKRTFKDLTGFIKYFTIRLIQSVVQSRSGQKVRTKCQYASERTDWFNIRIEELGEVTSEIRKATNGVYPPTVESLCLDFQLLTADGALLPLETWCVAFDTQQCDTTVNVRSQLYHQMGTLLKSALTASRVTPTYRYYVAKQTADSFVICYRNTLGDLAPVQQTLCAVEHNYVVLSIHHMRSRKNTTQLSHLSSITLAAPRLETLGAGRRSVRLGALPSPFGTLSLDLHYRTQMVLDSPTPDTTPPSIVAGHPLASHAYARTGGTTSANEQSGKTTSAAVVLTATQHGSGGDVQNRTPPASPFGEPSPGCHSTFSTSPGSMDLPWFGASPHKQHRNSVTFEVGPAGQSGTSSSDASASGGSQSALPKRNNSSGILFRMDISNDSHKDIAGAATTGATQSTTELTKSEDDEDHEADEAEGQAELPFCSSSLPERNSACSTVSLIYAKQQQQQTRKASFPFAALLCSSSSPALVVKRSESVCEMQHASAPKAPVAAPPKVLGATTSSKTSTVVEERTLEAASDPLYETAADPDDDDGELDSSSDSFVKVSGSLFACPKELSADLGSFVSSFKSAPPRLRSFDVPTVSDENLAVMGAAPPEARRAMSADRGGSLENLPGQLEQFEARQVTFDRFVKSLTLEDENEDEEG